MHVAEPSDCCLGISYEYLYCDAPLQENGIQRHGTTLEYDFVKKPSKDYLCPVTFELLTNPQQTSSCCGHHLSRAAADRLKRQGDACPLWNDWPLKTTDDPFFRRQVMAFKVRCSNKALGCEWVGGQVIKTAPCRRLSVSSAMLGVGLRCSAG